MNLVDLVRRIGRPSIQRRSSISALCRRSTHARRQATSPAEFRSADLPKHVPELRQFDSNAASLQIFLPPCAPGANATAATLDAAARVLIALRPDASTAAQAATPGAFEHLHEHLLRNDVAACPASFLPILTLIASRLSLLAQPAQREQAMALIELTLRAAPQLAVAEALVTQLRALDARLQQRVLAALEDVLRRTAGQPHSHVEILVELADAVHIPQCRERAYALVKRGLMQLRSEPELANRIRCGLTIGFCRDGEHLALAS